jgi:hypothetical protein
VRRIVYVSETAVDPEIVDLLRSTGCDVILVASREEAWSRGDEGSLVVLPLSLGQEGDDSQERQELLARIRSEAARPGAQVLLLVEGATAKDNLRPLFEGRTVSNFLSLCPMRALESRDLVVTVSKMIADGDVLGMERYLAPALQDISLSLCDSREKDRVVDAVCAFAERVGCHPVVARSVGDAADELITNAIYNAPVDAEGRFCFAHLPRWTPVTLDSGKEAVVRCAFDGTRLCLSVRDYYGSLKPARLLDCLSRGVSMGDDQVEHKVGGMGVGLYQVFNFMHHLVVNIAPGECTEVMGLLYATRSYRQYSERAKSLNVFLKKGPSSYASGLAPG